MQTKRFLSINLEVAYFAFFELLFIWNRNENYVYTLSYFPRKPYPIQDQNGQNVACAQTPAFPQKKSGKETSLNRRR